MEERTVFFVSDRTGITAETLGISLISQFDGIHFKHVTLPFVDSTQKAHEATNRINESAQKDQSTPLVFSTIVIPEIRDILINSRSHFVDFFQTFIPDLEKTLGVASKPIVGRTHGAYDVQAYNARIDAVNFALAFDDGIRTSGYEAADIILIGVSRCGKTPTCLYLAMQFGIRAANYPFTEEDLDHAQLPGFLLPYQHKLFGLTIDPLRLAAIRQGRRPDSQYANVEKCLFEIKTINRLFEREKIPYLNATHLSIEELATQIRMIAKLKQN